MEEQDETTTTSSTLPNPNHKTLAGCLFTSGAHLSHRLHEVLFTYQIDEQISERDAALIVDVVKQGHPNAEGKLGDGVKMVKVINHPEYKTTRCFWIVRNDDTGADFSYRKCVEALFPGWNATKGNPKHHKGVVVRFEVKEGFAFNLEESSKRKREEAENGDKAEEEDGEKEADKKKRKVEENKDNELATLPEGASGAEAPKKPVDDAAAKKRKREERKLEKLQEQLNRQSVKTKRKELVEKLKQVFSAFGTVVFVEFDEKDKSKVTTGFIRYASNPSEANAAVEALEKINEEQAANGIQFASLKVIEGNEETEYYKRLDEAQDRRHDREKGRNGKRGGRGGRGRPFRGGGRGGGKRQRVNDAPSTTEEGEKKETASSDSQKKEEGANKKEGAGGRGGRGRGGRGGRGAGGRGGRGAGGRGGKGANAADKLKTVAKGQDFEDKDLEMGMDSHGRPKKASGGAVSSIPTIGSRKNK